MEASSLLLLSMGIEPQLEGAAPVSVLTRTSSYSAFADTVVGSTVFRLNVAGEVSLKGLEKDRAVVDFSSLLQFGDAALGVDRRGLDDLLFHDL